MRRPWKAEVGGSKVRVLLEPPTDNPPRYRGNANCTQVLSPRPTWCRHGDNGHHLGPIRRVVDLARTLAQRLGCLQPALVDGRGLYKMTHYPNIDITFR
jgi:hypothetical protein